MRWIYRHTLCIHKKERVVRSGSCAEVHQRIEEGKALSLSKKRIAEWSGVYSTI